MNGDYTQNVGRPATSIRTLVSTFCISYHSSFYQKLFSRPSNIRQYVLPVLPLAKEPNFKQNEKREAHVPLQININRS